ncbi:MAG TPA: hypothetical protein VF072_05165 [Thermoleophilaceae bacterium]
MPNGVFPRPNVRTNRQSSPSQSVWMRLRTRRQRNQLDRQIAAGVTPNPLTPLGVRAAQLHSPATRAQLANALVETVGEARRGTPMNIRPRPQRAEVRAEAEALLALASRLRESTPIDIRGAALVALLVNDTASPLHRPGTRSLGDALAEAHAALIPAHAPEHELRQAA